MTPEAFKKKRAGWWYVCEPWREMWSRGNENSTSHGRAQIWEITGPMPLRKANAMLRKIRGEKQK